MKSFIDKAVVMLFSALLILNTFTGSYKIILIFMMVIVASFTSFLRMLGGKGILANKILLLLISACIVIWPDMIVFAPISAYEIFIDRHLSAGLILVVGFMRFSLGINISREIQESVIDDNISEKTVFMASHAYASVFILMQTVLSVFLSYKTQWLQKYEAENKKIRDEGEINKEILKKQNKNLMEEQDKTISSAQLAERNRIAREIHDNVGHMLSRSLLQVGAMMVVHKDEKIAEELSSLRETLDTAMNNIRNSVHDLRDEAIDLKSALEEIAEPLKGSFMVVFEFDADTDGVSKDIKYAVINIVKEAVSNIIKYSQNKNVDIRFYEHPSMYQIIVHDYPDNQGNGSGNQKNSQTYNEHGDGMGLENIRIRAEKLGGNASFTNENGFRVFVRLPKEN